jgi:hypothetical protein
LLKLNGNWRAALKVIMKIETTLGMDYYVKDALPPKQTYLLMLR